MKDISLTKIPLILALVIAGGFGLATVWFIPTRTAALTDKGYSDESGSSLAKSSEEFSQDVHSEHLVDFCSQHVSQDRSFVVFKKGTCVVVTEPSEDPVSEALERLKACDEPNARFIPEFTKEGDLIISFKEPVFLNFSRAEIVEVLPQLDHQFSTLLTPKERAEAGDEWVPPLHAKLGLLARRRMLEDAAKPVAVQVIRSKERLSAQR